MSLQTVHLKEWDCITLPNVELSDKNARETAMSITEKGILEVVELKTGLLINSNSYVGRIKLGDLQVNIYPKLNGVPLYQLLRYTYGLRELKLFNAAEHSIDEFSFFDLLIYQLYVEAEDLLRRGIDKSYISREQYLSSPRGRIDTNKLCMQGGVIKDTLPCRYFSRDENNVLNRTLLAGLKLCLKLVMDNGLKIQLQRLSAILGECIEDIRLTRSGLQRAWNSLNRLTGRYTAVLEIINILYESQGIQLEDGSMKLNLHGYFFDMNAFFETLMFRLLSNCSEEYFIKDQYNLHDMFIYTPGYNPMRRKSPTPRPDFAQMKDGKVVKLLDAKYRDLWEKSLPREMLYQLAIYAVSGIGNKTATILYPSLNEVPSVQKIDINEPVFSSKIAGVILQPVNLKKVAGLVSNDNRSQLLREYVTDLLGT